MGHLEASHHVNELDGRILSVFLMHMPLLAMRSQILEI